MAKGDRITVKQQKFADLYIEYGNATQAAIEAGYKGKYAANNTDKLLKNKNVSAYIKKRMEELQSEKVASQQEVLEYLTSVMRGEVQDEVILVVPNELGADVARTQKRSDTTDRTKAAELLGKRYALFTDKQQIDGDLSITIEVDYGEGEEDGN